MSLWTYTCGEDDVIVSLPATNSPEDVTFISRTSIHASSNLNPYSNSTPKFTSHFKSMKNSIPIFDSTVELSGDTVRSNGASVSKELDSDEPLVCTAMERGGHSVSVSALEDHQGEDVRLVCNFVLEY